MKSDDKKNHFRIAVLGHSNVGKSALTVRYLTRRYIGEYRSNSDLLYRQTVHVQNSQLDVEIIDVSGETRDCEFPSELVQWADACLLVYSITERASFDTARRLMAALAASSAAQRPVLALLANKADLEHLRLVSEAEGKSAAEELGVYFSELSVAEHGEQVVQVFESVLLQCKQPRSPSSSSGNINKIPPYQVISPTLSSNENGTKSGRKFSVTKMLGSLIGKHSSSSPASSTGTVVVCHRSDLFRNKVWQRRHNFMAAVSL